MSKQGNTTLIGSFVVGAIALVGVSILIFAKQQMFTEKDRYVVYFEGSVGGLKIGAPVKLKGVQIGNVTDIDVQFDTVMKKVLTPVFLEIDPNMVAPARDGSKQEFDIDTLIEYGLRAQLTLFNMMTGHLYIEVDFLPDTPVRLVGSHSNIPEIPVVPSNSEEIQHTVTKVISDVRELPLREMFNSLLKTVVQIEKLVTSDELTASAENLVRTISRIERLVSRVDSKIDPLSRQSVAVVKELRDLIQALNRQTDLLGSATNETLSATRKAADQFSATLVAVENSADPNSPLYTRIDDTLRDVSAAARSVKIMADTIQQHPESLVYGKARSGID